MQRFVETFDEPAYAVDHELIITAWNRRAEQIFGWPAEDAIGHSADERLQPSYDWQLRRKRVTATPRLTSREGLTYASRPSRDPTRLRMPGDMLIRLR